MNRIEELHADPSIVSGQGGLPNPSESHILFIKTPVWIINLKKRLGGGGTITAGEAEISRIGGSGADYSGLVAPKIDAPQQAEISGSVIQKENFGKKFQRNKQR